MLLLLLIKFQAVLFFFTEMAAGYWLALIFQASHVVSEVGCVNNLQYWSSSNNSFMLASKLTKVTLGFVEEHQGYCLALDVYSVNW